MLLRPGPLLDPPTVEDKGARYTSMVEAMPLPARAEAGPEAASRFTRPTTGAKLLPGIGSPYVPMLTNVSRTAC